MVIAVINQKGGAGKTTLAVHLACWLADRGVNVAFIDADGQAASTTWLKEAAPNVKVINGTAPAVIDGAVAILRPHVAAIVADGPPGLDERTQALLRSADLALLPVAPSVIDVRATIQAIKVLEAIGAARGRPVDARLVLNKRRSGFALSKMTEESLLAQGVPAARSALGLREAFTAACLYGTTVGRMAAGKDKGARQAADEIEALFTEVLPHELWNQQDGGGAGAGDGGPERRRGEAGGADDAGAGLAAA